jgi:hypothetical protein
MTSQDFGRAIPFMDWSRGKLTGENVRESVRILGQMDGLYQNRSAWEEMDLNTIVYRVQWYAPVHLQPYSSSLKMKSDPSPPNTKTYTIDDLFTSRSG